MKNPPSEKEIVDALHATMGKVCLAAERLGCSPRSIYRRARKSRKIDAAIRFFRGKLLDLAESTLWGQVLDGQSWAVRLAFDLWGRSRDFSDGAEAWHQPHADGAGSSPHGFQHVVQELLNCHDYLEYCRTREIDRHAGDLRIAGEPRPVEDGAAPGGDGPGDRGDDPGANGADSGD